MNDESFGKDMAELSKKSVWTDDELNELIVFYRKVIDFLDNRGGPLVADALRWDLRSFENMKTMRKHGI
jgi:hypothetical protein